MSCGGKEKFRRDLASPFQVGDWNDVNILDPMSFGGWIPEWLQDGPVPFPLCLEYVFFLVITIFSFSTVKTNLPQIFKEEGISDEQT